MIRCAIVGVTGLVGSTFLKVLEEKNLPIDEYTLFASIRSKGKEIEFMGKTYIVEELTEESFEKTHFDYALFSAGSNTSEKFIPLAVKSGTTVIDNSSFFRMHDDCPLVVPEVNPEDIFSSSGIIANPNCSTIQLMLPLKALNDKFGIERVVCSTYQAVSGAGQAGIVDLLDTLKGKKPKKFKYPISSNCLPQIDVFLENLYTKEEMKMIEESRKILHLPNLKITATCARVPVKNCHSESVNITLKQEASLKEIYDCLSKFENIVIVDDILNEKYPINDLASGNDKVYVGRLRKDFSAKNTINLWIVADNIRKGAASNAVQILEKLLEHKENM